jgi:RNA polymerase-binding transcription factor DksA
MVLMLILMTSTQQLTYKNKYKMATQEQVRYSDEELQEFKELIEDKIEKAQKQLELYENAYKNGSANDTEDTAPTFKSFDDGSNTLSKEANSQLAIRQEKFIRDLKNALVRIENKTYGVCRVTGKLIRKERLKLVPHATLSIEAKNKQK